MNLARHFCNIMQILLLLMLMPLVLRASDEIPKTDPAMDLSMKLTTASIAYAAQTIRELQESSFSNERILEVVAKYYSILNEKQKKITTLSEPPLTTGEIELHQLNMKTFFVANVIYGLIDSKLLESDDVLFALQKKYMKDPDYQLDDYEAIKHHRQELKASISAGILPEMKKNPAAHIESLPASKRQEVLDDWINFVFLQFVMDEIKLHQMEETLAIFNKYSENPYDMWQSHIDMSVNFEILTQYFLEKGLDLLGLVRLHQVDFVFGMENGTDIPFDKKKIDLFITRIVFPLYTMHLLLAPVLPTGIVFPSIVFYKLKQLGITINFPDSHGKTFLCRSLEKITKSLKELEQDEKGLSESLFHMIYFSLREASKQNVAFKQACGENKSIFQHLRDHHIDKYLTDDMMEEIFSFENK